MTREDFMEHARAEIDVMFTNQRNRMMNLVEQAWAEGKKNSEIDYLNELFSDIIKRYNSRYNPEEENDDE